MKIKKALILLLVLFIPFFCYAEECNKNDIKIESIELSDIRGNAEELSSSNNNNNKINLNTKMNVIGDNITYKVLIKNTSSTDYTFDKNTLTKDYLSYDITYEDDSNIIKPDEEKVIYLRLSYDNKPEIENLVNGVLKGNEQISFDLTKETEFINPETGNKILLSLIYLLIPVITSFYLIKKKKTTFMLLLVLMIIPHIVSASCTCVTSLDINLALEIDRKEAIFLPGAEVNIKMKELAGDDTSTATNGYYFKDQNITAIKKGEAEPIESNKEEKNVVSTPESLYPIYMWYEDNTIYWWSEDNTPALNEDASYMFIYMNSLADINSLEHIDSSNAKNMSCLLAQNRSLLTIESLKKWNTSNVTDIGSLLYNDALTSLDGLEDWDVSKVTNMGGTFGNNTSLISLKGLENWNTKSVIKMNSIFSRDTSLKDVSAIRNWNVEKVENISTAFLNCYSVEIIDLSNWNTKSLKLMSNTFGMWTGSGSPTSDGQLRQIILSDKFNTSQVTNMYALFANNEKIEDYSFLQYINPQNATDVGQMLQNNKGLDSEEYIKNWNMESATDMHTMFYGDSALVKLDLSNWNTSNVTNMSFMFSNMTNLEELDISNFDTKNVTTFQRMFNDSPKLKHIYVGENWSTEANTGETKYVFPTTCELPNFSTSNPNYRYLSYAHVGEGGYLTLKTN